ncbi:MIP family channel protein [Polychaeton citri CBS 116435]|uniref:MIP family channel protein n=1 Tax=Polychaeton citri CBS 116435 TaxID=1314669 RepID=A0A9P4UUM3_9PEZI|nr:MIP family channel protein [Polychaeton citri CBS 116435]
MAQDQNDDVNTPLLQQERPRRRSTFASLSNSLGSSLRRGTVREIHPHHTELEPVLPAAPVAADHSTKLHNTNWAHSDDEPNTWAHIRHAWREEFAEFWGTFMILLFGAGVECQVNLHGNAGDFLQCRLTWAAGVAMAVWTSGGISGGHCNPSVTLALAAFRGFPWRKVPSFIIAQVLGATVASLVVYANYSSSIALFEADGTRSAMPCFFTFPASQLSYGGAFYTELLATAVLILIVFALSDKSNLPPPTGTQPFAMFLAILAIGAALGINTGYAMNGARDTGPRLALWIVGYGTKVWTHDHFYSIWCPWGATLVGGLLGAGIYDAFMYTGRDSPMNRPRMGSKEAVED